MPSSPAAIVLIDVDLSRLGAAAGVAQVVIGVLGIHLARRPTVAAVPPEIRAKLAAPGAAAGAPLPAEIEERIFVAEETSETTADDVSAREEAIALLERRLTEAGTAEERMPIRRRLRELREELANLSGPQTASTAGAPTTFFDPLWSLVYKLPPLGRRTRPWLAAAIGLVLGGIGLAVYFRKLVDLPVLAAIVGSALLVWAFFDIGHWWIHGGLASVYGYLRAESSNRRLAARSRESSARKVAQPAQS